MITAIDADNIKNNLEDVISDVEILEHDLQCRIDDLEEENEELKSRIEELEESTSFSNFEDFVSTLLRNVGSDEPSLGAVLALKYDIKKLLIEKYHISEVNL